MLFAQLGGRAAQLARTVRKTDYGDIRLLEDHTQATEDRLGACRVVRHEAGQALTLFDVRLECEDVDAALGQSEEAPPQRAWLVLDRHRELLRLRHTGRLSSFRDSDQHRGLLSYEIAPHIDISERVR